MLVSGELEDVLTHHDLSNMFNLAEFVADGDSGKVYRAAYKNKNGEKSGSQKTAVKIVERREDNEKELENEIRALRMLSKCNGVQRFLVAFEHCGDESQQLSSEGGDSEREGESKSNLATSETQEQKSSTCYIWVATKWVEGRSLLGLIESGQTFTSSQVKEVGEVLIETLERVHKKGIVHSDFDCSNIIVDSGNVPVVVDFGEAELVGSGGETGSDVVGLVLILVDMLTGSQRLFEDEKTVEEKCDYLQGAIEDDSIDEDLKGLCKDVCRKCASSCTAKDFIDHEYFAQ